MTINLSDVVGITMNGSSVVKIEDSLGTVLWQAGSAPDPSTEYFYVENLSNTANTISIKKSDSSAPTITVYYSTDKTNWNSFNTSVGGSNISIPANSKVYLKASSNTGWGNNYYYNSISAVNGDFAVGGNIMSLIYGNVFLGQTTLPGNYCFKYLFNYFYALSNINDLVLPATNLTPYCYHSMFSDCRGLTSVPSDLLPAMALTDNCYSGMFFNCIRLTNVPDLPATTLANSCYSGMFNGCTSLTSVPENLLPATTLATSCYTQMFGYCKITEAPRLPATTLVRGCYQYMFSECERLRKIVCYADNISASDCTYYWVNGVANNGTFYKLGSASWTTGNNGIPTGWLIDTDVPEDTYFYVHNRDNSSNTLSIQKTNASTTTLTVYYSTDKTNWYSLTTSTTKKNITIPANSRIYIKSTNFGWNKSPSPSSDPMECRNVITWNGTSVSVGGNIMSLLYGDDFEDKTSFTPRGGSYCLYRLFKDLGSKLDNINNLILPSVSLSDHCYDEMFKGCSSITSIPLGFLPAPTIPTHGYYQMFEDCTGLTSIPSDLLPALQVTQTSSYCNMFKGCTGLTSIPSNLLPATEVGMTAYAGMFRGCTSLTTLPSNLLPATNLQYDYGCYQYMFADCTGLTSVPPDLLPATTLESQCYANMFSGCTSLTKTPDLPATTLTDYCYSNMFSGCTNLEKVICYANDISASNCTNMWLYNVAGSGTFYKLGSASWTLDSESGIPTGWTVETEYPELTYFYLTNTGSNNATIGLTHTNGGEEMMWEGFNGGTIYYSTDQNNWNEWGRYVLNIDSDPETGDMSANWDGGITDTITLTPNQKIYFRCNGPMMVENEMGGMYMDEPIGQFFTMNGNTNIQAGGNIWSLRYGQNFTTSEGVNLIGPIFNGCTILKNIDSLSICNNNMTLAGGVLARLFKYTGITSIPSGFFDNAVNLGSSNWGYPEGVFYQMFMGCTGLTTINGSYIFYVPTLYTANGGTANYCYASMFEGCSSLNMPANPPKLFNNDLVVSSNSVSQSFYSMFKGCTSLTKTPIINVETSDTTSGHYEVFSSMFYGCTNLARVDFYNSQSSHGWSSEFTDWLYNVAGTGDFYTNTGMTWTTNSTSGIPSGWTRHDLGA